MAGAKVTPEQCLAFTKPTEGARKHAAPRLPAPAPTPPRCPVLRPLPSRPAPFFIACFLNHCQRQPQPQLRQNNSASRRPGRKHSGGHAAGFLCKLEANKFDIEFLAFKIRDAKAGGKVRSRRCARPRDLPRNVLAVRAVLTLARSHPADIFRRREAGTRRVRAAPNAVFPRPWHCRRRTHVIR